MLKKTIIFSVVLLVAIQFIPLDRTNPPVDKNIELKTNPEVMKILKKSCYDCHSNETKWSEYAYVAPLSFGVVSHVEDARQALNFSNYKNIDKEIKIARMKGAIHTLKINTMPLESYLKFHEEAKLTKEDKTILINWFSAELEKLQNQP